MAVVVRVTGAPVHMWMIGAGRFKAAYKPKLDLRWVPFTGVRLRIAAAPVRIWGTNHIQPTQERSIWNMCLIQEKVWHAKTQGNTIRALSREHHGP